MPTALTLVVGGAPAMAEALRRSGRFQAVHAVGSTGQLRDLVGSGDLPRDKNQMVFLFADNLTVDTGQTTLDVLVGKLTQTGRKVIVLGMTPNAQQLVAAHRQAGLLPGPFQLNATLGAIAGLGLAQLEAIDDPAAFQNFDPVNGPAPQIDVTAPEPAAPAPAAAGGGGWEQPAEAAGDDQGGWAQAVAEPAWGGQQPAWGEEPQSSQPQQPQPSQPQQPQPSQPQQPQPSQPQQPQPSQQPQQPQQPQRRPSLADAARQQRADEAEAAPQPATPGRGMSLADAAAGGGGTSPQQVKQDLNSWQEAGGWGEAVAPTPSSDAAPVGRGGLAVQHEQVRRRRGWVITISSPKGGTGKTSLSTNLAAFLGLQLRDEGKTICLIDGNYGQADVGKILDQYMPNVVDLARDPSAVHVDRIMQHLVHRPDLNMSVLLGPASPKDANPVYITPKLYNQILDVLKELFDYIIIDTQVAERFSSMHSDFSIPRSNRLIVPVNPNLATLMNADAWLRSICEPTHAGGIGYREDQVGILLNMAMEGVDCDVDDVMRELGSWTFVGDIPLTPVWQKALNNNDLVATYNYEELNKAFATVLYAATGEQALMHHNLGARAASTADAGLADKVRGWFKKVVS